MAVRIWSNVAALVAVVMAHTALAQDKPFDLTPAGKAILQAAITADSRLHDRDRAGRPQTFPNPMCTFPGGLCGAVRRDGTVAVLPRYDWIGPFSEGRAAVRLGGLYGFVDEEGREVVRPQYRIVDDYKFGFAQVDVDGKSGLIDRDGRMVIAPKYGFVAAIGPGRFRASEHRRLGGPVGSENFSGSRVEFTATGGIRVSIPGPFLETGDATSGILDLSGQWSEPPGASRPREFDQDNPSLRWVQRDSLWGLARADGSWLVEPMFQQADPLADGLARVTDDGKTGFVDRTGNFAIAPVFDRAWPFRPGFGRTSAQRDGVFGVIDKSGAWVFQTNHQHIHAAVAFGGTPRSETVFGWHFTTADRWGLLDVDGRVVLDADFDQTIQRCADGRLVAYRNKEQLIFKGDGSPLQPPDGRLLDASCGSVPPYILKIGDKFGLLDAGFSPLTPVHFDAVTPIGPGVKNVKIDGKWGRIGPDDRWRLEPRFDYLSGGADLFVASIGGKRGFMRSDGSWLIEPKFDAARYRNDGTAFVTVSGATGVLRLPDQPPTDQSLTDQSWVVPPRPGVMCDIRHAIMSQADGKRTILSRTGETWIDIGAERIGIILDAGLLTFLKNGRWGLVDTAGQVIVEPRFDEPVYFTRGLAWARSDRKWCAIDRRGRPVPGIPCADEDPVSRPGGRFECKVEP
jgi:hypothetical protein